MNEPVDRRFFGLLWQSFSHVHGWTLGLGGIMVSMAAWNWASTTTVAVPPVVGVGLFLVLVIIVLAQAYYTAHREMLRTVPRVRRAHAVGAGLDGVAILLLDPSPLFMAGYTVSVHWIEDDLETRAGIGRVVSVQENGCVQVLVESVLGDDGIFKNLITSNDSAMLTRLSVKPTVHALDLERVAARKGGGRVGPTPQGAA